MTLYEVNASLESLAPYTYTHIRTFINHTLAFRTQGDGSPRHNERKYTHTIALL